MTEEAIREAWEALGVDFGNCIGGPTQIMRGDTPGNVVLIWEDPLAGRRAFAIEDAPTPYGIDFCEIF